MAFSHDDWNSTDHARGQISHRGTTLKEVQETARGPAAYYKKEAWQNKVFQRNSCVELFLSSARTNIAEKWSNCAEMWNCIRWAHIFYPAANSSANNFTQSKYFYRLSTMISLQSLFGLDKYVHSQSIITVRYDFAQVHNVFHFYCYCFPNCNKVHYPKYSPTLAEVI